MKNVKDIYENQRVKDLKSKLKEKFNNGKDWVMDNKENIKVLVPIAIGIAIPIVKTVSKNVTIRRARDVKELYCYDRSLGHYWSLKRELTNNEWVTIDRRKKNGERLADILESMKVLK